MIKKILVNERVKGMRCNRSAMGAVCGSGMWVGLCLESLSWYYCFRKVSRQEPPGFNTGSDDIYFSRDGTLPEKLAKNNRMRQVKSILEKEFGIDEYLKISFGGKHLSAGSKISYRYFLLFNTLSGEL